MRKESERKGVGRAIIALLLFFIGASLAQFPNALLYQGKLRGAGGSPVADGTYAITFRVYDAPTGGTKLYEETQNVQVIGGNFTVFLGQNSPALKALFQVSAVNVKPYFLEIQVQGDTPMSPRQPLTPSPYAFLAQEALDAGKVGGVGVSKTPQPGALLPLDANGMFPLTVLPPLSGTFVEKNPTAPQTLLPTGDFPGLILKGQGVFDTTTFTLTGQTTPWFEIEDKNGLPLFSFSPQAEGLFCPQGCSFEGLHEIRSKNGFRFLLGDGTKDAGLDLQNVNPSFFAHLQLSGDISARKFFGDGSGLINLPPQPVAPNSVGSNEIIDGSVNGLDIDPMTVQKRVTGTCPSGQVLLAINPDGTVSCGPDIGATGTVLLNPAGPQTIRPTVDLVPLTLQGVAGQTAPLFQIQDSGGLSLFSVDPSGSIVVKGSILAQGGLLDLTQNTPAPSFIFNNNNIDIQANSPGPSTVRIENPDISGVANLSVEGDLTFDGFSITKNTPGNMSIQLNDAANTVLNITNTGTGTASLQVEGATVLTSANGVITNPSTAQTIQPTVDLVPLTLQGVAGQTFSLFEIRDSGGFSLFSVDPSGSIVVKGNILAQGATVLTSANGVITNPSTAQTIQPTADVTPLIIKDDTAGTTTDLFDVQDNAGTSLLKVNPSGNLLVGNPAFTTPKVSAEETGTAVAGYFKINNASNVESAVYGTTNGTGNAVRGYNNGTGVAGAFTINNASNTNSAVTGTTNGTGHGGIFFVTNTANSNAGVVGQTNGIGQGVLGKTTGGGVAVFGLADVTATGSAGKFLITNTANSAPLVLGNTAGTGNLLQLQQLGVDKFVVLNDGNAQIQGNAVTVTKGATPMLIQSGNACDTLTGGTISVTFPVAFSATPTVTFVWTSSAFANPSSIITGKTPSDFTVMADTAFVGDDCIDWIAIGPK